MIFIAFGVATCSCLSGMKGSPPHCRPECIMSADCSQSESCIRNRCVNPCTENPCGSRAICDVKNHNPICRCEGRLIGDPFIQCHEPKPDDEVTVEKNPCDPTPCKFIKTLFVEVLLF